MNNILSNMKKCYVVAEAGVNHNGSDELALKLVGEAANAGADAVKFQTFTASKLVSKDAVTAEYQQRQAGERSQFEMLEKLQMSEELHIKLIQECERLGIEFLSTPFDIEAAEFLLKLGMKKIKIASGELTNIPLIKQLAKFDVPMILSTGMSSLEEVRDAVNAIAHTRQELGFDEPLNDMLTVLHCTSNYPARLQDVNLKAMQTMKDELLLPVGYSDHTEGIFVSVCAVAMGAMLIEKHFTLDKNMSGPDHKASLSPGELKQMVREIRCIEICLGDGVKVPRASELPIRELVRRSVVLKVNKCAGEVIGLDDLILLRPGGGIPPVDMQRVVGKRVLIDCKSEAILQWSDLE